jgi:hypothetical protein
MSFKKKLSLKNVESHPAWEDYITWKNKEQYIFDLKEKLKIIREYFATAYTLNSVSIA